MIKEKKFFIDRLRIIATFAVVMIHICMTEVENDSISNIGSANYVVYSVGYNMVRWAVPIFIMITGFLLLQPEKELSKEKLKNYIVRMVATLLIFGTIYAAMEIIFSDGLASWYLILPKAFLRVLQMKSWDHLWYLYLLIGLYIITPFTKAAIKNITEEQLEFLLCALFILDYCIPAINMATGIGFSTFYISANQYFFYYLMGYYLSIKNNRFIRNSKIIYLVGTISFIIMSAWDSMKIILFGEYSHWVRMANFLIPPVAVAIFILFLSNDRFNNQEGKILKSISKCSFGIYLIHPFYVNIFYKVFHITPTCMPIVFGILILFLIVFVLSWISTWVVMKLPVLKKLL